MVRTASWAINGAVLFRHRALESQKNRPLRGRAFSVFCDRKRNGLESPQPRRSTVGHLPLEQVIGVRIPARLPTFRRKLHEELGSRSQGVRISVAACVQFRGAAEGSLRAINFPGG